MNHQRKANMTVQCALCKTYIPNNAATYTLNENEEKTLITCPRCSTILGTCHECTNGNSCDFDTNPSKTPKIVQQKIQQGSITQIIQVKNPERISETCMKNCPCYNSEYECGKSFGICGNFSSKFSS